MESIEVTKSHALKVIDALASGAPISPPGQAWRRVDMLNLAGACVFGVLSQGPIIGQPDLSHEQQVDSDRSFIQEVLGTVEVLSHIFQLLRDGEYDARFEPYIKAVVHEQAKKVQAIEGFKDEGGHL
jgi:hypothetical protein